jgi:hypothetical protein
MMTGMANDPDPKPPSALKDLTKGLGLLFRAARTTLQKLPTGELEAAVVTSAKEVGRAIENVTSTVAQTVTQTVEKQVLRRTHDAGPQHPESSPPQGTPTGADGATPSSPPRPPRPEVRVAVGGESAAKGATDTAKPGSGPAS